MQMTEMIHVTRDNNKRKTGLRTLNSSFDIKEAVLRYGHKASDMLLMCLWDRQFCSPLNFTTRFSQLYGLCHTFNSGQDGHHLMYSMSIKRSRGLQMLLLIEKDKYYGIMSYINTGIRMTVHDQDEEPMVEVNGVDVMPGHMTTIKIQREEYISLPPPFKSACGSRTLKTSKIYSRSKCVMECTTRKVIRQCGCRLLGLPDLPEYNGSKHCTPKEMFSCGIFDYPSSSEVKVSFLNALFKYFLTSDSSYSTDNPGRECDCPKTCTQIQHKIAQINVISLLSESFLRETFPFRETPNKDQEIRNLMTSFRDNLALLVIQYDDLYTHRTSEREAYGIDDFGSDVGGYLGLFLGCSILTFFEIFDFIISYLLGKQKPKNQVEQSDCKIENQVTGSINSAIDRSEGNEVLPSN